MSPFDIVQAALLALPRADALHAELRRGYAADKDDLRPRGWLAAIVVAGTKRLQDYALVSRGDRVELVWKHGVREAVRNVRPAEHARRIALHGLLVEAFPVGGNSAQ